MTGCYVSVPICEEEYLELADFVYTNFGIFLSDKKKHLVKARLASLLNRHGFSTYKEYIRYLREEEDVRSLLELIDQITTNHTFFYREENHFDYLTQQVFPEFLGNPARRQSREVRIWCAGCSSGEEPYTVAMVLDHFMQQNGLDWQIRILATDISITALHKAEEGVYDAEKVKSLPEHYLKKYLLKEEGRYRIQPSLRKMVVFRRLNLMTSPYPFRKQFDVVFCRNVMIYFDAQSRRKLVENIHSIIVPDGYFFIGHTESLMDEKDLFHFVLSAVYRKSGVKK